jgi:uncharacterized Zn finger protein
MAECSLPGDRLVCDNCGRDTFAVRRENGLEVKYHDRWGLILKDTIGTILFRCRHCGSVTAYSLSGNRGSVATPAVPGDAGN